MNHSKLSNQSNRNPLVFTNFTTIHVRKNKIKLIKEEKWHFMRNWFSPLTIYFYFSRNSDGEFRKKYQSAMRLEGKLAEQCLICKGTDTVWPDMNPDAMGAYTSAPLIKPLVLDTINKKILHSSYILFLYVARSPERHINISCFLQRKLAGNKLAPQTQWILGAFNI